MKTAKQLTKPPASMQPMVTAPLDSVVLVVFREKPGTECLTIECRWRFISDPRAGSWWAVSDAGKPLSLLRYEPLGWIPGRRR